MSLDGIYIRLGTRTCFKHLNLTPCFLFWKFIGGFDEGAAQVRRLLDRDRKELDFDELESAFADPSSTDNEPIDRTPTLPAPTGTADIAQEASPANSGARFSADKTPVSPFGPSSTSSASPFSASPPPTARKPFNEPAGLSPTMQPDVIDSAPWWTKITLTQIVIVLSFTTIISLMIATFFFVLNVGAIRINE